MKTAPGPYPLIVTAAQLSTSSEFQFDGEAVCIPMVSSTGHGHASLKRVHYASGKFAVANIIAAVQLKDASSNSTKFLALHLQHYKDELIVTRMRGTANVSLSIAGLKTIPINLPPLAEQQRIVDLIGSLDDAIQAADEAAQNSSLSAIELRRDHFEDTIETVSVGEVYDVIVGKQLQRNSMVGEPAPYLRAGNIGNGFLDVGEMKMMRFTEDELSRLELRLLDVVIVEGGNGYGKSAVWSGQVPGQVALQNHVLRLRSTTPGYSSEYAHQWARWCHEQGQFKSTGTGIPNLGVGKIRKMLIPVPSAESTSEIEILVTADAATVVTAAYAASLRSLRSELLTVLLSGEHEIPESYDAFLTSTSQLEPAA